MANPFDINPFDVDKSATQPQPFDTTPLGHVVNFFAAVPEATFNVGKDIVQQTASSFSSIGNTILNTIFPKAGMDVVKVPQQLQGLYGQSEIKDLGNRVLDLTKTIAQSPTAQKYGIDKQAPAIAFAGVLGDSALNLLGWGGGAAEEQLIKTLAKETDPEIIGSLLRQHGIAPAIADKFAPDIAEHTTPEQVKSTLQIMQGVQHLGETTEALNTAPKDETGMKILDLNQPLKSEEYDIFNNAFHDQAKAVDAPITHLPENITGREALSIINEASAQGDTNILERVADDFKNSGYTRIINYDKGSYSPSAAMADYMGKKSSVLPTVSSSSELTSATPALDPQATDEIVNKASKDWEKNYAQKYLAGDTAEQLKLEQEFKDTWLPLTQPQKVVDKLPPSVGEIIANGKKYAAESTPAEALYNAVPDKERPSFGTYVKSFLNGNNKGQAHALDFLATPEFVLEKLGLGKEAAMLHDAQDVYRENLKTEIERIQKWKDAVDGHAPTSPEDSSREIFKYLDGQERSTKSEMTPEEYEVAREIRDYFKEWADRLHLPQEARIARYVTRLFDADVTKKGFEDSADPELLAIMQDKVAGSVYDPFLEKRLGGKGYKEDVWASLDAYVKRATRKEAFDPALEALDKASKKLDPLSYKYVQDYSHGINMRPTELDKFVDSFIKQSPIGYKLGDRPVAYLTQKARQGYYRGFLGLNPGSALRNLSQGANTYAKLKEKYTVIGYAKLFGRMISRNLGELYDVGIMDDQFIQDQKVGVYKNLMQKADPVLFSMFETAEKINRGAAYFGAKARALDAGATEEQAIKDAKRLVRETQFAFGRVDSPVLLRGDLVKTGLQLGTYNLKQIEFLSRMVKDRDIAGAIRWSAASLAFVATLGKLFGMTVDQLIPSIGLGHAPAISTFSGVATELSPGASAQDKAAAQKKIATGIVGRIPGGIQLRKSIQGVEAYMKGKDTTAMGRTRYTIKQDIPTFIRVLLFGKSSLPAAQEYYDKLDNKNAPAKGASSNAFNI